MANIIIAPGKYIQGKCEINNLGSYVNKLGSKSLIRTSLYLIYVLFFYSFLI